MHLQIPQTQIGGNDTLTLGILGQEWMHEAGENGENNRVQFILRDKCSGLRLIDVLQQMLGVYGKVSGSSQKGESTILFSVLVVDQLRDPRRLLEAIARKVSKAVKEADDRAYEEYVDYVNSDDHC